MIDGCPNVYCVGLCEHTGHLSDTGWQAAGSSVKAAGPRFLRRARGAFSVVGSEETCAQIRVQETKNRGRFSSDGCSGTLRRCRRRKGQRFDQPSARPAVLKPRKLATCKTSQRPIPGNGLFTMPVQGCALGTQHTVPGCGLTCNNHGGPSHSTEKNCQWPHERLIHFDCVTKVQPHGWLGMQPILGWSNLQKRHVHTRANQRQNVATTTLVESCQVG